MCIRMRESKTRERGKSNDKLKDLTEKQIVKELRRKSPSELLNWQSNARIQRANGVIRKRLGNFQQAEDNSKS